MWLSPSTSVLLPDSLHLDELQEFVDQHEWNFEDEHEASDEAPYHIVWMTLDRRTRVRYVDDAWLGARYFYFSGREAESFAREALAFFDAPSLEALLGAVDALTAQLGGAADEASADEHRRALSRCAVCAREHDGRVAERFERGLAQREPALRFATLQAIGYAEWPELEPLLETAAQDDDEEVAELARELLETLRRDVWPMR